MSDRVTCAACSSSFGPGTRFCGRCGASIGAASPSVNPAPTGARSAQPPRREAATRRPLFPARADSWARRKRPRGHPLGNVIFTVAGTLAAASTLAALCFGPGIVTALSVRWFEYRPSGPELWALWALLALAVIVAGLVLVQFVVWVIGDVRLSGLWVIAGLVGAYVAAGYFWAWPEAVRSSQVNSWPTDIGVATFEVCTTRLDGLSGRGRIVVEIVNHSNRALREATFTIARSHNVLGFGNLDRPILRVEEWDLRAGDRRRHAVDDLDLDIVKHETWNRRSGSYTTSSASAELLWDRVRFEGMGQPEVADRPSSTSLHIEPCPD